MKNTLPKPSTRIRALAMGMRFALLLALICFGGSASAKTSIFMENNNDPIVLTPVITAGAATGYISACVGSASASPNIEQFTVSGSNLTANITVTAPAGFGVSLAAGSGYNHTATIAQSGGTADSVIVYVRSAATAPAGPIAGNVALSSTGAETINVAVTGTISSFLTANPVANQTVDGGSATAPVNFTGNAYAYNWVNDTPGIGLPASGSGNIPSFNAVNNGDSPITATITVTPAGQILAYIANDGSNNVSVINTGNNQVEATIPVGQFPYGVSVSPDGARAYVANAGGKSVSVINTAADAVTATIAVGKTPQVLAVSPDGSRVYVANTGDFTISVINTVTNNVTATISRITVSGLAISPDGTKLYVADNGAFFVYSTSTNTLITAFSIPKGGVGVATSPDGSKIYVTSNNPNSITVIDAANNVVTTSIPVGYSPNALCVSADGTRLYVTTPDNGTVLVINTATNTVIATIGVGGQPTGISITTDGTRLYVVNYQDNSVSVINTATNTVIAAIPVGNFPVSIGNFITPGSKCITPTTFTLTVKPHPPVVSLSGTPATLTTKTGRASAVTSFNVSGSYIPSGILVSAPAGFEVSAASTSGFGPTVTIGGAGAIASTPVYVRLAAADAAGNYSGNIVCSAGTASVNEATGAGVVNTSANANLTNLKLSAGTLTPAFSTGKTSYTVSVGNGKTAITATPTAQDAAALIKVNGSTVASGSPSGAIALSIGPNTIAIKVTGHDGAMNTYTVTVTRAPSVNDNLSSLKMSKGVFSPGFSSGNTSYTDAVGNPITSITVTPTTADPTATVKVNGTTVTSGAASGAINLAVGSNTITTVVTAQNGTTTKTYTVTVNRATGGADSYVTGISVTKPTETPALAEDGILVHQGVSPNGDGVNDFLQIDNISRYPNNKLSIMNRNGQLIYQATGYDNSSKVFDGHSNKNGQMQLPGTYFYQLDYTVSGITRHKTGFIVLKY